MRRARALAICIGFMIVASSCADSERVSHGGMSGGGGNLLPGKRPEAPLDPERVEHLVKASRPVAIEYLTGLKRKHQLNLLSPDQAALASKAFSGERDLLAVSQATRAHLEEDAPCRDFGGNPVDGSLRSRKTNAICISSHSIATKVHESEIPAQSAALMIHEFSELSGFSEEEATMLQIQAYSDLLEQYR